MVSVLYIYKYTYTHTYAYANIVGMFIYAFDLSIYE